MGGGGGGSGRGGGGRGEEEGRTVEVGLVMMAESHHHADASFFCAGGSCDPPGAGYSGEDYRYECNHDCNYSLLSFTYIHVKRSNCPRISGTVLDFLPSSWVLEGHT